MSRVAESARGPAPCASATSKRPAESVATGGSAPLALSAITRCGCAGSLHCRERLACTGPVTSGANVTSTSRRSNGATVSRFHAGVKRGSLLASFETRSVSLPAFTTASTTVRGAPIDTRPKSIPPESSESSGTPSTSSRAGTSTRAASGSLPSSWMRPA
jgi:hypothetical protein